MAKWRWRREHLAGDHPAGGSTSPARTTKVSMAALALYLASRPTGREERLPRGVLDGAIGAVLRDLRDAHDGEHRQDGEGRVAERAERWPGGRTGAESFSEVPKCGGDEEELQETTPNVLTR